MRASRKRGMFWPTTSRLHPGDQIRAASTAIFFIEGYCRVRAPAGPFWPCQRGRLKGSEGHCVYERHARACARNSDMPESLQRSSDGRCRATWAKQVGSAFLPPRLGQDALGFVRCQSVHFDGAGELPPLLGPRHPLAASLASVPVSLSHSFLTTRFRKPC